MRNIINILAPVVLVSLVLAGCAGGVNENKPIAQVQTEAKSMNANKLQAMVDQYKKVMEAKKTELKKLNEKLKAVPVTELLGDEAKVIKGDIEAVAKSIRALGERLNVYARELKQKMQERID